MIIIISPYILSLGTVHVLTPETLRTHLDAASLADAQGGIVDVQVAGIVSNCIQMCHPLFDYRVVDVRVR
eukprot:2621785-Amphidinium_carterae.1